jgi:hypothetical protein
MSCTLLLLICPFRWRYAAAFVLIHRGLFFVTDGPILHITMLSFSFANMGALFPFVFFVLAPQEVDDTVGGLGIKFNRADRFIVSFNFVVQKTMPLSGPGF